MTEKKLKRVLIMAGGTGGHVFPGLAVARSMREQGVDIHWLGTSQGLEARLVPEASIPLHTIKIGGLRGKNLKTLLTAPFRVVQAIAQARAILKQIKPDVVLGMGGFASGPGGMASWLLGIPLVIHEQNAIAGFTNKVLARFARKVLEGFPSSFPASANVIAVGNPVRAEIENIPAPNERFKQRQNSFRLLVLGGSLGAQALNQVIPKALAQLNLDKRPEVWHQAGDKHFAETESAYKSMGVQANVVPFVKDMAQAYAWADMVICRAGALTVAELCAAGLGAVFVPYPHAVDDHQTANAQFMVKNDAALCIQQSDLTEAHLTDIVRGFAAAPDQRLRMAEAAYGLRKIHVAEKIYQICQEVVR